ncbi:MAG: 30S ribosomal protein S3ae [Candidatus Thermoplasmatota archaeon]|nr:30S ribosomal protein S3ae [Candidatus Thermoplasmatota archaeon]
MAKKTTSRKEKKKVKEWYTVLAPQALNSVQIAEVLGSEPESMVGRKIEATMQDLGAGLSKQNYKFIFKITDVQGLQASTEFVGHTLMGGTTRVTRKRHAKIDQVADVVTLDSKKMRLKVMAITERKIHRLQESAMRKRIVERLQEDVSKLTLEELIRKLMDDSLSTELFNECKKIEPIRRMDIRASEFL